jgi:cyclopropane-fatty-acyl-phospholipid synthase
MRPSRSNGSDMHEPSDRLSVQLTPQFEDVQAHYDLSDDYYRLFLDPTQTYSCAYFERDDMTLEEAQIAKIDMALGELGLLPGMTLFDIGCGWGATMRRAIEEYDVNVIGLTLSKNQAAHVQKMFEEMDCRRSRRVLLQGWEQFDEPADRIVSIGAFEHFGHERHARFLKWLTTHCRRTARCCLQSIVRATFKERKRLGLPTTADLVHSSNSSWTRSSRPAGCQRSTRRSKSTRSGPASR